MIAADNLCNSNEETLERVKQITNKELTFYKIDVTNEAAVDTVFYTHQLDGVIHFAGLKAGTRCLTVRMCQVVKYSGWESHRVR